MTKQTEFSLAQAIAEAGRCLLCHDAPCSAGCPAGTDPALFIRKLRLRNIKGAIRTIKTNNVLGGSCGALCPAPDLCEKKCSATGIGDPIRIARIQRALVEHGWRIGFNPHGKPKASGKRVAVVGAGPSGLACAAELAKAGFRVTVFEKARRAGGVPGRLLPEHRVPRSLIAREAAEVKALGVEFRLGHAPESIRGLLKKGFGCVYVATGTWQPVRLTPEGGRPHGVYSALEALENAAAFGRKCRGKEVLVVGGGDVAMDVAEVARLAGARQVSIVYRRSFNQMPAHADRKQDLLERGVHFLFLLQPLRYVQKKGKLEGAVVVRNRLGGLDAGGRERPVAVPGTEQVVACDILVEAAGFGPTEADRPLLRGLGRHPDGMILADERTGRTSMARVFAGGDVARGPASVVEAVADGKRAAKAIARRLKG